MLNWLILMDNNDNNSKYPHKWVFGQLYNFSKIFPSNVDLQIAIIWKTRIFFIKILDDKSIIEVEQKKLKLDGAIFSLTENSINEITNKPQIIEEIVKYIDPNSPLILHMGKTFEKRFKELFLLKNKKLIYSQRIAINWFSTSLKNLVLNYI